MRYAVLIHSNVISPIVLQFKEHKPDEYVE